MINVWVVEDIVDMRMVYADLINSSKDIICSHHFGSVEEAEEALKQFSTPDVILMDIALPGLNGIQGLSKIKESHPNTHIIIQTIFEDNEKIFEAICAGASGYLLKRSMGAKVLDSIRDVMNGGAPMNSQIAKKVLTMFNNYVIPQSSYDLTQREREILSLLVDALSVKDIADKLNLSSFTVSTHVKNIYSKLHVNSRSSAVAKALKERLI